MTFFTKKYYLFALFLYLANLPSYANILKNSKCEILWDTWGVPHIYASNDENLLYAHGWAQMENHANLILALYGRSRGKAAEYWGESFLDSDKQTHMLGIPKRAKDWYSQQSPKEKKLLDAFVNGMNDYSKKNLSKIDVSMRPLLPLSPEDVLSHTQRVYHLFFISGNALGDIQKWYSSGSNSWAIGKKKSSSGNAMLLCNPHLPWSFLFTLFEAHWNSPNTNVYGVSPVGIPMLVMAFNSKLGWTHTNNTFDGMDLYELNLKNGGYLFNGKVEKFNQDTISIKIRQKDGKFKTEQFIANSSVHGPIVTLKGSKALSIRITGLDQPHIFGQYWDMAHSKNLVEFEKHISKLQIPFFNIIYADKSGHVMYLFGGLTPKRPKGDWDFWQGIVPGDTSSTLWTETLPYNLLPKIIDPPSSAVQNSNDSPWTSTFPQTIFPIDYPLYISPNEMDFRAKQSAKMLFGNKKISFDELISFKNSTHVELTDHILDDFLLFSLNSDDKLILDASNILKKWDRTVDAESVGSVLFLEWINECKILSNTSVNNSSNQYKVLWNTQDPLNTPRSLSNLDSAVASLKKAAVSIINKYGSLSVKWGNVYRMKVGEFSFPSSGGPSEIGVFRSLSYTETSNHIYNVIGGESYIALIEFDKTVKAKVLLTYGNSSQQGSKHHGDQLELFSRKQMRNALINRADIENSLEFKEIIK